jgi:outer membrane receptor protein involved in Fe transport
MKNLLRPTLALLLTMPIGLIGQTIPDANQPITNAVPSASDQDVEEELYVLPEFVVSNDQDEGYYSANSTSVTRTNTLVKNSPISMSIVNEQLLDDLNILSTQDLAMVSAAIDEDPSGYSLDRIRIRGFRNTFPRFNFFKRNLPTDSYNIARVDIIKGANSLIFGQASPGGTVSNSPMLANFRENTKAITAAVGIKDFQRTTFNANQIINENFAVRVMGVHSEQGYDHPLKSNELDAWTVATTMKLTPKTQLRLHLEGVSATNRFPNRAMRDKTEIDDNHFGDDARASYSGILSQADYSDSITSYEVPFSPDWVEHLPQQALDWIINHTAANPVSDRITSRQDLRNHYSLINSANYGAVSGPDKFNDRDGAFAMADFEHEINENLHLNLSLNAEQLDAKGLGRDLEGSVRVRESYTDNTQNNRPYPSYPTNEQYIRTYWTKNDISTDRMGSRTSLVFENDWFNAKNRIILGWDFNSQTRDERVWDQVPVGAGLGTDRPGVPAGAFLTQNQLNNDKVTDDQRAFEYISLSRPYNRSIHRFNEIIESDLMEYIVYGDNPRTGPLETDFEIRTELGSNDGNEAEWALSRTSLSKLKSNSLWFAEQSEFFNGRLHTLLGLRYDHIQIESTLRKVSLDGYADTDGIDRNNKASVAYDKLNPTIGGLFWVNDKIGIFANYAQSIETPSGTERTPLGEIAPPELGEGIEFGLRFDLFSGKLDGQLAYYSITKENDNEFRYSISSLSEIYPRDIYGAEHDIYYDNGRIRKALLPGQRGVGDKTRSEGVELDFTYNPLPGLSFIGSYNYTVANEILELHPLIPNPEDFELFGRPDHRATFTGRYKFRDGLLKGLAIGASQRYRSAANQTRFDLHYDENGNAVGESVAGGRTDRVYLNFGDEHTTSAFATWEKKLGPRRSDPKLTLAFRVINLFDNTDFTGRENYGFYRESRSYNFSGKIQF